MTGSASVTPVSVSLVSSLPSAPRTPTLSSPFTDLKGNPVGDLKVTLDSATKTSDDSSLSHQQVLTKSWKRLQQPGPDGPVPEPAYEIVVSAAPAKAIPLSWASPA